MDSWIRLESQAKESDSLVDEIHWRLGWIQSTPGHVESGGNVGGPSPKAKYDLVTDRGIVPWGKGEKNPGRGVKENLKPYVYKQRERDIGATLYFL